MKHFFTIVFALFFTLTGFSQDYNLPLIGELNYDADGSDIWGYVDNQGTEYAILGVRNGTAIISLADPTNPVEVAFISGGNSTWRDMKSFGNYAYITTEAADGILVVDMSDIANGNETHSFYEPELGAPLNGQLRTIHNLYIDENGFCYIAGSNLNNGGVLIFDLNQDPVEPPLVGVCENIYSHDVYVRNNICWSSNVNDGHFSAIDVSDKANPVTLAYQQTTFDFTHNAWLSDDGNFLYTTDELANANIDAYDVSDLDNIMLVDTWIPPTTVGDGVIPHNVHVKDDYLVISYYTDGVKIVDAHRPHNLVEVGSYDSFTGSNFVGFQGCWGAYPFLPSGLILASDINRALLVLDPNYQRACYLEGAVTNDGGIPLNNVSISLSSGLQEVTPSNGQYATGQVTAGTFQATYSKVGYISQTVDVVLENGEVTIQDIVLLSDAPLNITGQVIDAISGNPIANAAVRIQSPSEYFVATTDAMGNFDVGSLFTNQYQVYAGKWGHSTEVVEIAATASATNNVVIELTEGYEDPFAVDLGWTTETTASAGHWVLDLPIGTFYNNSANNVDFDVEGDVGDWCYMTGNGGGGVGTDDVDGGVVTLYSPIFDVSSYVNPYLSYQAWFINGGGSTPINDKLEISILNGTDEVVLETYEEDPSGWHDPTNFRIEDYITVTATMQLKVQTSDFPGSGHVVEGALDNFRVYDDFAIPVEEILDISMNISPNPFQSQLNINLPESMNTGVLTVYDALGRLIHSEKISNKTLIQLDTKEWALGLYQIVYTSNETRIISQVVKQ